MRSVVAVVAGLIAIVATHLGADELMRVLSVFPPSNEPIYDQRLTFLAFSYRSVFSVLGCYLTARLAPRAPMTHALILGGIGTALSIAGLVATAGMNLGPRWYPIALVLSALPCAWLGGLLLAAQRQTQLRAAR